MKKRKSIETIEATRHDELSNNWEGEGDRTGALAAARQVVRREQK